MLVLFDQDTLVAIRRFVPRGNKVGAICPMELRAAEESAFDVLLTTDSNLRYQQNLQDRRWAIVILSRNKSDSSDVRPDCQRGRNG